MLFVLLLLFNIALSAGEPSFDASAHLWLAHYEASHNLVLIGSYLGLYVASFVVFVAALWARFRSVGDSAGIASIALLISSGVTLAMWMASGAVNEAAAIRVDHGLDVSEAGTLADLATGFFVMSWLGLAVMLLAVGFGALSSGALPRWLGWAGGLIGASFLFASAAPLAVFAFVPFVSFYSWIASVSVVILLSGRRITREAVQRQADPTAKSF